MGDKVRFNAWYLLPLFVVGALLASELRGAAGSVAVLPYSEFQQLLAQQKVKEVVIEGETLRGELKEPLKEGPNAGRVAFVTNQVRPELAAALEQHGVTFAARIESPLLRAVAWLAPFLLLIGLWATEIARSMVTRYGMLPELGPLAYETEPGFLPGLPQAARRLYSEETAHDIDLALRGLVEAAHAQALRILEANRPLLVEGAGQLLAKETLADGELAGVLRRVVMPPSIVPVAAAVKPAASA